MYSAPAGVGGSGLGVTSATHGVVDSAQTGPVGAASDLAGTVGYTSKLGSSEKKPINDKLPGILQEGHLIPGQETTQINKSQLPGTFIGQGVTTFNTNTTTTSTYNPTSLTSAETAAAYQQAGYTTIGEVQHIVGPPKPFVVDTMPFDNEDTFVHSGNSVNLNPSHTHNIGTTGSYGTGQTSTYQTATYSQQPTSTYDQSTVHGQSTYGQSTYGQSHGQTGYDSSYSGNQNSDSREAYEQGKEKSSNMFGKGQATGYNANTMGSKDSSDAGAHGTTAERGVDKRVESGLRKEQGTELAGHGGLHDTSAVHDSSNPAHFAKEGENLTQQAGRDDKSRRY